jgi:hypothetical protein
LLRWGGGEATRSRPLLQLLIPREGGYAAGLLAVELTRRTGSSIKQSFICSKLKFSRIAFDGDVRRRLVHRSRSERPGGQNCLSEVTVLGCFCVALTERLWPLGPTPGARSERSKLPDFFKML